MNDRSYLNDDCTVGTILMTPAIAANWLKPVDEGGKALGYQRKAVPSNLAQMKRTIEDGFFPITTAHLCTVDGSDERLIDAYHRLTCVAASGRAMRMAVVRHDAHSEEDRRWLYDMFDNGGRVRQWHQSAPIDELMEVFGLERSQITWLAQAAPLLIGGFSAVSFQRTADHVVTHQMRRDAIWKWGKLGREYFSAVSGSILLKSEMRRAMVVALGIVTIEALGENAIRFWNPVANNDGLRKGDARHYAYRVLSDGNRFKGSHDIEFARTLAVCWNRYLNGGNVEAIQAKTVQQPVPLKGTGVVIGS